MRLSICTLFIFLLCSRSVDAATAQGSHYQDKHGGQVVGTTLQLAPGEWAYWAVPVNAASAPYEATVYASGKYRADAHDGTYWQNQGTFTGTASFPDTTGLVAIHARTAVTVWAVGVE